MNLDPRNCNKLNYRYFKVIKLIILLCVHFNLYHSS